MQCDLKSILDMAIAGRIRKMVALKLIKSAFEKGELIDTTQFDIKQIPLNLKNIANTLSRIIS